jgi:poly-beta-1,6-N-acetyl-D-glucosamine synthase
MSLAIGIMAHDEEANIVAALRSILAQSGPRVGVFEVVVVASGCTDGTVPLARELAAGDRRVRVVEQAVREGKASAINLFLGAARGSALLVLAGADTRLEPGALDALLAPFDDPGVGMTGGRPVPVNTPDTLLGRVVRLQWDLHDAVARREPKLGELIAFRTPPAPLDPATAVDEAFLEAAFLRHGLRRVYVPEARVAMKGPTTVADFLAQRRRIHAGHLRLRRDAGHAVSTLGARRAFSCAVELRRRGLTSWTTIVVTALLELAGRALGAWDVFVARRDHRAWRPIRSTKDLTS